MKAKHFNQFIRTVTKSEIRSESFVGRLAGIHLTLYRVVKNRFELIAFANIMASLYILADQLHSILQRVKRTEFYLRASWTVAGLWAKTFPSDASNGVDVKCSCTSLVKLLFGGTGYTVVLLSFHVKWGVFPCSEIKHPQYKPHTSFRETVSKS